MEGEAATAGGGAGGGDAGETHRPEPVCAHKEPQPELPGSYAYDLSTHFVARHPWAWDAPRVGLVPGLSLGCRLRVSCFLREDACVVRLCNGLCKMVYS